jgi:hypothetical protein
MRLRLLSMGLPLHPRRRMELRKPSLYLYVWVMIWYQSYVRWRAT